LFKNRYGPLITCDTPKYEQSEYNGIEINIYQALCQLFLSIWFLDIEAFCTFEGGFTGTRNLMSCGSGNLC